VAFHPEAVRVGGDDEQGCESANSVECIEVAAGTRLLADDIANRWNGNPAGQCFEANFQRGGDWHGLDRSQRTDFSNDRQAEREVAG
jgi:hypothetical protein